jgi:hypothetical protein
MANQFKTTSYVLDDVLVRFINYLNFAKTSNRNFESDFKNLRYATGQTIDYRIEERYLGGRGATAVSEDRVQITRPLTIDTQFHTMVEFDGFELTFDRAMDEPYLAMMVDPRAKAIANDVEKYIAEENFYLQTYQATGTPGVALDFDTISDTRAYAGELAIPDDGRRYMATPYRVSSQVTRDLQNSFNNRVNTGALLDGFIGHLSGFDMFETAFLPRHISGAGEAGGSPPTGFKLGGTVTGGPVSSGSSLSLTGLVASSIVFRKGDIIEVDDADGVFMVNPLNRNSLQQRAQFVVTADVTSDGAGAATVPISPEIIVSGARQNLSAVIPNGAQILLRDDHNVSIMYHSNALVFAAPQLKELKGGVNAVTRYSDQYKMSMTMSQGADIKNYQQLDRVDLIAGVRINPEFAIRVCS